MGKTRSMNRKKKHDEAGSKINTIKTCDNSSDNSSDNSGVAPWSDLDDDVLFLVTMKIRSMNRKKKHDNHALSEMNTIKTCDSSSGVAHPWSDLNHDVLFLVMIKLGVGDFLAFNIVCKSWRSLTVSNRNKFIVSRPPMSIFISTHYNENSYLEDFEGNKFKITLPGLVIGRRCVGVTCGYLILFLEYKYTATNTFWLVNLITRHELCFPNAPDNLLCCPGLFRAILVFTPSTSRWVLVVFSRCDNYAHELWFCIESEKEWTEVSTPFPIQDLIAFKGRIYTLHSNEESREVGICEMRLYPEPKLVLLEIENFWKTDFRIPGFVTFGENLYVIDRWASEHPYKIHEIDLDEMKWVSRENTGEKYAFFRGDRKTFTLQEAWADIHSQYRRYAVNKKNRNGRLFHAKMWYFFQDCFNVNLLHE